MPEYLAPGVYVEETSFRSKSLEGVSTSTAGFVGPTRYGPTSGDPELVTSFLDFQRIYGGLDDLRFGDGAGGLLPAQRNYLAHAVRAFFEEGGKRLFITRAFGFADAFAVNNDGVPSAHYGFADTSSIAAAAPQIGVRARFPGAAGNLRVTFTARVAANALITGGAAPTLSRVQEYDVVFAHVGAAPVRDDGLFTVRWDRVNRRWALRGNGAELLLDDASLANAQIRPVSILVDVEWPSADSPTGFGSAQTQGEFGFDARGNRGITDTFTRQPSTRFLFLTVPFAMELPTAFDQEANPNDDAIPLNIARELLGATVIGTFATDGTPVASRRTVLTLQGGDDGDVPDESAYGGVDDGFVDYINDPLLEPKNGLRAFEGVEDISIVAAPGYTVGYADSDAAADRVLAIQNAVINHCEYMRYRIAVLDTPANMLPTEALTYRNLRSSTHAAIYYPWITVADPQGDGRLNLPPSGFMAGIYARNDVEHAVFKAPANEIVRLAIDFELRLNKAQQELLNPQGVNCMRYFAGRGFRVWGARTISDDPEWKYVNLRRYFAYLEHTVDRGTQWVVFENNGPQLWDNVRRTVEDFLFNEWKMGALLGDKPEKAYFVRCDRSTMTQNDLDNGRLICLIGVAPVRPAEFVIFRIGQWTADAER